MCSFERDAAVSHHGRLYRHVDRLQDDVCDFTEEGLAAGEPVLVVARRGTLEVLRARLDGMPPGVRCEQIEELGLNPARIIPAWLDWVERSSPPVRIACEPLWKGRGHGETVEVMRHEALIERALSGSSAKVLCLFLEDQLAPCARASLGRSHHTVREADGTVHERVSEPHSVADLLGANPLDPACDSVDQLAVRGEGDLGRVRKRVAASGAVADLSPGRRADFVLAVNEAATNALEYGEAPHALRVWRRGGEVIGEISGPGSIEDPLVGRRRPSPGAIRGRGLWMINQLCDLVELRSDGSRTTLRMHQHCG